MSSSFLRSNISTLPLSFTCVLSVGYQINTVGCVRGKDYATQFVSWDLLLNFCSVSSETRNDFSCKFTKLTKLTKRCGMDRLSGGKRGSQKEIFLV